METKATEKKLGWGYRIFLSPEVSILIPVIIMCVITTILNPKFIVWSNLSYVIETGMYVGYLALGEALIIMNGEIDLSVGMSGGLSSVIAGVAASMWGLPPWMAICCGLLTGMLVGLVNGLISAKFGLISWIVTLATQFVCSGLAQFISNGKPMRFSNEMYAERYSAIGTFKSSTLPVVQFSYMFVIFIIVLVILDIVVRRTKFGYNLRAVGGNKESALLAGINVSNVKLATFIIAGLFAGMYGVAYIIRQMSTNISQGSGGEFRAITCCAIGGITMSGGKGSIYGIGLGVLLFHVVNGALQSLGADNNVQLLMVGCLLVIAVLINIFRQKMEARKMV